jgi:hypothetical protein
MGKERSHAVREAALVPAAAAAAAACEDALSGRSRRGPSAGRFPPVSVCFVCLYDHMGLRAGHISGITKTTSI